MARPFRSSSPTPLAETSPARSPRCWRRPVAGSSHRRIRMTRRPRASTRSIASGRSTTTSRCGRQGRSWCSPRRREARNREVMGATNPADAAEGTIRKVYAESIEANRSMVRTATRTLGSRSTSSSSPTKSSGKTAQRIGLTVAKRFCQSRVAIPCCATSSAVTSSLGEISSSWRARSRPRRRDRRRGCCFLRN